MNRNYRIKYSVRLTWLDDWYEQHERKSSITVEHIIVEYPVLYICECLFSGYLFGALK